MNYVTISALFDELEKVAQGSPPAPIATNTPPPLAPTPSMGMSGVGGPQAGQPPVAQPPGNLADQNRASSPVTKTSSVLDALIAKTIANPYIATNAVSGVSRVGKGAERHRKMMEAVEHPYPASWVPLEMRPGD